MSDQPTDQVPTAKPEPLVITLREFAERSEEVIDNMTAQGQPVMVTHRGCFVALIQPVNDQEVISAALTRGPLAEELRER